MSVDGGGVYLLYIPSESCLGVDVFKIGQTQHFMARKYDYPDDSVLLRYRSCREPLRTERALLQLYLDHVQVTIHRGREYLAGITAVMLNIYDQYFTAHPHGELVGLNNDMSKLSVATVSAVKTNIVSIAPVVNTAIVMRSPDVTNASVSSNMSGGFGYNNIASSQNTTIQNLIPNSNIKTTGHKLQGYRSINAHPDVVKHVCDFMETRCTSIASSGSRIFMIYHNKKLIAWANKISHYDVYEQYQQWVIDKLLPKDYYQPEIEVDWNTIATDPVYTGVIKSGRKDKNRSKSFGEPPNLFRPTYEYLNVSIGRESDGSLTRGQKIALAIYEGRLPCVSVMEHFVSIVMDHYGATDQHGNLVGTSKSSVMTVYSTKRTEYSFEDFCLDRVYLHSYRKTYNFPQ